MQSGAEPLIKTVLTGLQLASGGGVFYVVQRLFKEVEEKLDDETKLDIGLWLVTFPPLGPKVRSWPETFAKVFDRVFGTKHLSLQCFRRSALTTILCMFLIFGMFLLSLTGIQSLKYNVGPAWAMATSLTLKLAIFALFVSLYVALLFFSNIPADYISLLKSRYALHVLTRASSVVSRTAILVADALLSLVLGLVGYALFSAIMWRVGKTALGVADELSLQLPVGSQIFRLDLWAFIVRDVKLAFTGDFRSRADAATIMYPAFFTSVWLWLYVGSGVILKVARRLDIGFDWFNRHFDIEKKPLQSIGLVAGAICAVVSWVVLIGSHFAS